VARVLDFGIATALEHIEETAPEVARASAATCRPSNCRGERLTQRSDVFATGVVIWELLAMRRLFTPDQEKEPGEAVLRGDYPALAIPTRSAAGARHIVGARSLHRARGALC